MSYSKVFYGSFLDCPCLTSPCKLPLLYPEAGLLHKPFSDLSIKSRVREMVHLFL